MAKVEYSAVGRRKEAIARVRLVAAYVWSLSHNQDKPTANAGKQ